MNNQSGGTSAKASGVRAFTLILIGFLLITAEIFIFSSAEAVPEPAHKRAVSKKPVSASAVKTTEPSQEKAVVKKSVFSSNEVIQKQDYRQIQGAVKPDPKKLSYNLGVKDKTGRSNVRTSNLNVGADYKLSKNATVSVQASQGMHDSGDASAWGKSIDDEAGAQAKYKLSF